MSQARLFVGVDIGTSGVRAIAIDEVGAIQGQTSAPMPPPEERAGAVVQDPAIWWQATTGMLGGLCREIDGQSVAALAVDGTSGTLLVGDPGGRPLSLGHMYNDASAGHLAPRIRAVAPPESGAHGATSPLARLIVLQAKHPQARYALHQADWVAGKLIGRFGQSDENNALKLGYDPVQRHWPGWLDELGVRRGLLPEVLEPGTLLGTIDTGIAAELGISAACRIIAGTTDGCASFLATGASDVGDGVTALGSTLTIKLLSDRPIFAPEFGVYSHQLGEWWLVGGASNSGGNALLRVLTPDQIADLTPQLRPDEPTGYDWHPLPGKGERFPLADPEKTFEPDPLPSDSRMLLQALLEGIAGVEARAYRLLAELGGPPLRSMRTVGGGASSPGWTAIRARLLGVPMLQPTSGEGAYGTALLARRAVIHG